MPNNSVYRLQGLLENAIINLEMADWSYETDIALDDVRLALAIVEREFVGPHSITLPTNQLSFDDIKLP